MSRKPRKFESRDEDSKSTNESRKDGKPRRKRPNSTSSNFRKFDDRRPNNNGKPNVQVSSANDVTWYSKSPEQVTNAANLSFLNAAGYKTNVIPESVGGIISEGWSAPGVLRCGFIPTFGNPRQPYDAMNIAMNKFFAETRRKNSGHSNYFAPDLMKYLIFMDSAYAYAGFLTRTYGFINSYSAMNRYWPRAIFDAMGVDYADLRQHIAQFRTMINNYIARINSWAVPTMLPIFQRHYWMSSNVYKDADTEFAQCYVHVPEVYPTYSIDSGDVVFKLLNTIPATKDEDLNLLTFVDLETIANEISGCITYNEDWNIMSGDILKAYEGQVFNVSEVPADFKLYPVYDPGVLNQIMNSYAVGTIVLDSLATPAGSTIPEPALTKGTKVFSLSEDINTQTLMLGEYKGETPNDSIVKTHNIRFLCMSRTTEVIPPELVQGLNNRQYLINLTVDNPSPLHVIESTRLSAIGKYESFNNGYTGMKSITFELEGCGVDVYTRFNMFYYKDGELAMSNPYTSLVNIQVYTGNPLYDYPHNFDLLQELFLLDSFDWHPVLLTYGNGEKDGNALLKRIFPLYTDLYRYAKCTKQILQNIHDVANLSLFDVTTRTNFK